MEEILDDLDHGDMDPGEESQLRHPQMVIGKGKREGGGGKMRE